MMVYENLVNSVKDYNSLAEKHNIKSRLMWKHDTKELVLGTKEQFEANVYECCIAKSINSALVITKAFIMSECFERGE